MGKSVKRASKKIYKGLVKYGTFETKISTFIGYFVGLLIGLLGIYFIMRKNKYSGKTIATITPYNGQNICSLNDDRKTYNCTFNLVYNINGQDLIKTINNITVSKQYVDKQTITIYYNPDDLTDINTQSQSSKLLGCILILISVFIIFFSWFQYYRVKKFKFLAASEGVSSLFRIFK